MIQKFHRIPEARPTCLRHGSVCQETRPPQKLVNVTILALNVTSKQSVDAALEAVKKSERGGGKMK